MSYDRIDWHYGGDYPDGLPPENGGTHIGMFLAWAFENGMAGSDHKEDSRAELKMLAQRQITGRDFLIDVCDEKFWSDDLNELGQAFASDYYESETAFSEEYGWYLDDYCNCFNKHAAENGFEYESTYHVENTWENYDRLKPLVDKRFREWQAWRLQPGNDQTDPRTIFENACNEIAVGLAEAGFKPSRKGTVWKKVGADRDTVFEVSFEPDRYNTRSNVRMSAQFAVYSRELKRWLIELHGNRYESGLFHFKGLDPKAPASDWALSGSQYAQSVEKLRARIAESVMPIVELFSDRARTLEHLANRDRHQDEGLLDLAYLLRFGTEEQAEGLFNRYVQSRPTPWRNKIIKHYAELPDASSIDLTLHEYVGAADVKLAFKHGIRLLPNG